MTWSDDGALVVAYFSTLHDRAENVIVADVLHRETSSSICVHASSAATSPSPGWHFVEVVGTETIVELFHVFRHPRGSQALTIRSGSAGFCLNAVDIRSLQLVQQQPLRRFVLSHLDRITLGRRSTFTFAASPTGALAVRICAPTREQDEPFYYYLYVVQTDCFSSSAN